VFAGKSDAAHWRSWSALVEEKIEASQPSGLDFYLDQTALNVVINIDGLPAAILPSPCNWLCHWALPSIYRGRVGGRFGVS
jgi:hypothetical protein